jgi:hypothetical protein
MQGAAFPNHLQTFIPGHRIAIPMRCQVIFALGLLLAGCVTPNPLSPASPSSSPLFLPLFGDGNATATYPGLAIIGHFHVGTGYVVANVDIHALSAYASTLCRGANDDNDDWLQTVTDAHGVTHALTASTGWCQSGAFVGLQAGWWNRTLAWDERLWNDTTQDYEVAPPGTYTWHVALNYYADATYLGRHPGPLVSQEQPANPIQANLEVQFTVTPDRIQLQQQPVITTGTLDVNASSVVAHVGAFNPGPEAYSTPTGCGAPKAWDVLTDSSGHNLTRLEPPPMHSCSFVPPGRFWPGTWETATVAWNKQLWTGAGQSPGHWEHGESGHYEVAPPGDYQWRVGINHWGLGRHWTGPLDQGATFTIHIPQ